LTKRQAKDSGTAMSKLYVEASDVKVDLQVSINERVLVDATLDRFRGNLLAREAELIIEQKKVVELTGIIKDCKESNAKLSAELVFQERVMKTLEGQFNTAERARNTAFRMTEAVGRDLNEHRKRTEYAEVELVPAVDNSERLMAQVLDLQKQLKATEPVIKDLKKDVQKHKMLEQAAVSRMENHFKTVADLTETVDKNDKTDRIAKAMTKDIAARLYEEQKKAPPLAREIKSYQEQLVRATENMNKMQDDIPAREAEIKKLAEDLKASRSATIQWQSQVKGIEAQIPPLNEKLLEKTSQLRDELALKAEMTKELHKCRKRTALAEEQAEEMTSHVQRLIDQLKAEGKQPPPSPKSPKSPEDWGKGKKGRALKGSESLPAIPGEKKTARFG